MVSVRYLPPPCAIIHSCASSVTTYCRLLPPMAGLPADRVVFLFFSIVYNSNIIVRGFNILNSVVQGLVFGFHVFSVLVGQFLVELALDAPQRVQRLAYLRGHLADLLSNSCYIHSNR